MTNPLPSPTEQEKAILSIKKSVGKIESELVSLRETVAIYARNVIDARAEISGEITLLRDDLAKSRDYRFSLEEQQINSKLQQVERDANDLRKQLQEVQQAKETNTKDTADIEQIAQKQFVRQNEEVQKTKQLETKTKFEKRKEVAINAAIGFLAVVIVGVLVKELVPVFDAFLQAIASGIK